jgi:hypothetical protein
MSSAPARGKCLQGDTKVICPCSVCTWGYSISLCGDRQRNIEVNAVIIGIHKHKHKQWLKVGSGYNKKLFNV